MLISPLSSKNLLSNTITTTISTTTTTSTRSSDFPFYPSSATPTPKLLPCKCISSSFLKPLLSSDALRRVSHTASNDDRDNGNSTDHHHPPQFVSSASAVVSAIRRASNSPVEFTQRIEKDHKSRLVLPSPDFQRLCVEQLHLFRRIVDPDALLSVYVRPAGSYVMDRLELRQVISYPGEGVRMADIVILIGNFNVPTGLRAAETALSNQQVEEIPGCRAIVFPMVKHPFVIGFLVAELPMVEGHESLHYPSPEEVYALPPSGMDMKFGNMPRFKEKQLRTYNLTAEQRSNAVNISRSLAMAYVMDQKSMLLQQSTWQNNVRMSNLVEQIRGPLSSIRTLSKMLSLQMKRSEVSFDIVEDIMVQGDRMKDTLQQLQDAVYLTKANIMRYNEETLRKMHTSTYVQPGPVRTELSDLSRERSEASKLSTSTAKDLELPMPPLALAPLQHGIRPCSVSEVLSDLVGAIRPLVHKQERLVEFRELSGSLQVAVEEPALRQALSNLIEGALLRTQVGGKVEVVSTGAPAGGSLVVIDDDGPDMHYMTQMHLLTPFGPDLLSEDMVEDNMTWNFVAGLTVARETLESYGCVVRVISPRTLDAALGAGGTRIELWLPSFAKLSDNSPSQEL